MKWDKYIVIFIFLGILLVGGYLQLSQRDLLHRKVREKTLSELIFTVPDSMQSQSDKLNYYRKNFNNYYENRFSLESDFFSVYQYFESNLYATNPIPNKVLEGKDGFLFLGDDFSNAFSESKGYEQFRGGHFKLIRTQLCAKRAWLEKQGISYYVAIAPNKLTIYDEKIPIRKASEETKRVQVKHYFNEEENSIIDLSEILLTNKKDGLYFKTDSHWNDLGAYYSYVQLVTEIQKDFPQVAILKKSDFTKESSVTYQNDQTRMLQTNRKEVVTNLIVKDPNGRIVNQELCIPDYYRQDFTIYEKRYRSNINKLKVLLLGDSFGTWWGQYLAESFGEVVVIRHNRFDPNLIAKEQPDIVINEFIERNIEELMVRPTKPLE